MDRNCFRKVFFFNLATSVWRFFRIWYFSSVSIYQDIGDNEAKLSTQSPDESNYIDNEIGDDSDGNKSEKDDLYYDKDDCSMQEYEIMKVSEKYCEKKVLHLFIYLFIYLDILLPK